MTTETPPRTTPNVRLPMLGVLFGLLLAMLDNFIVGTALPSVLNELGGAPVLSWVVTAYTLTAAATTPIWGKLGDLYGRKRMILTAVGLFVVGSVLAAIAPTMGMLIGARVVQGIGAGGLAVSAFAVIGDLVPPRERGKYQGMVAIVVAAGTIGGPLLGGFLTDALSWRWAFLINLPLGILTLVWVALSLHVKHERRRARIDWIGAMLLVVSLSAVVLISTWAGSAFPWFSPQAIALVVVAVVSLAAFVWQERRAPEPLLPLRIFATRNFTMAAVLALVSGVILFACVLYLPLFQQNVQGVSASVSGLLLLPMMIPVVIASQVAGRIMSVTGRYKILPIIGTASAVLGSVLLATMTTTTPVALTACFMVLMGIASGLTQQMTTTIAQNSVEHRDIGAASGAVTMVRTAGGSIAVAIFGSIYAAHTSGLATGALEPGIAASVSQIFVIVAVVAALGLAAALTLRETPLRGTR